MMISVTHSVTYKHIIISRMSRPNRGSTRTKILIPENTFNESELEDLRGAFNLFTNGSGKMNPK